MPVSAAVGQVDRRRRRPARLRRLDLGVDRRGDSASGSDSTSERSTSRSSSSLEIDVELPARARLRARGGGAGRARLHRDGLRLRLAMRTGRSSTFVGFAATPARPPASAPAFAAGAGPSAAAAFGIERGDAVAQQDRDLVRAFGARALRRAHPELDRAARGRRAPRSASPSFSSAHAVVRVLGRGSPAGARSPCRSCRSAGRRSPRRAADRDRPPAARSPARSPRSLRGVGRSHARQLDLRRRDRERLVELDVRLEVVVERSKPSSREGRVVAGFEAARVLGVPSWLVVLARRRRSRRWRHLGRELLQRHEALHDLARALVVAAAAGTARRAAGRPAAAGPRASARDRRRRAARSARAPRRSARSRASRRSPPRRPCPGAAGCGRRRRERRRAWARARAAGDRRWPRRRSRSGARARAATCSYSGGGLGVQVLLAQQLGDLDPARGVARIDRRHLAQQLERLALLALLVVAVGRRLQRVDRLRGEAHALVELGERLVAPSGGSGSRFRICLKTATARASKPSRMYWSATF